MTTRIYSHPSCLQHDPGEGHPENPGRLENVLTGLKQLEYLEWLEAGQASDEQIDRVHAPGFLAAIRKLAPTEHSRRLDADTVMNAASLDASLRAAGGLCGAVDAVVSGDSDNAFCAVRPPGHHAEPAQAMGFCIFNGVAVAAAHAIAAHGLDKVAVVDFDVHHGNGTQAMFWEHPRMGYFSTHQMPLYPGTGHASETGQGNIFNHPLEAGAGSGEWRKAYGDHLLQELEDFSPDLILVSAGFDAHKLDPLAQLNMETEDFTWLTEQLLELAAGTAGGRLVSVMEGGYHLGALTESAVAHVDAMQRFAAQTET